MEKLNRILSKKYFRSEEFASLIILILLSGTTFGTVFAITNYFLSIPSTVVQKPDIILSLSAYDTLGVPITGLSFGELYKGENSSRIIEIYNNGNTNIILSLSQPSNAFLSLTWDYDNLVIVPLGFIYANITLHMSNNIPSVTINTVHDLNVIITPSVFA
jgi:hypothetical protein